MLVDEESMDEIYGSGTNAESKETNDEDDDGKTEWSGSTKSAMTTATTTDTAQQS